MMTPSENNLKARQNRRNTHTAKENMTEATQNCSYMWLSQGVY